MARSEYRLQPGPSMPTSLAEFNGLISFSIKIVLREVLQVLFVQASTLAKLLVMCIVHLLLPIASIDKRLDTMYKTI